MLLPVKCQTIMKTEKWYVLSENAVKWVQKTVFLYSPSVQLLLLWLLLTIQSKSSKIVVAAIHSAVKFIGFKNIKLGPIQQCCTKFCLHEGYVIKFYFFFYCLRGVGSALSAFWRLLCSVLELYGVTPSGVSII